MRTFITNRTLKLRRIGVRSLLAPVWRTPIFAHIAPTRACNYKCSYCFQHDDTSPVMSWRMFLDTLRSCERLGVRIISFTGGEPLLWEHIGDAIHECSNRGLLVGLTTNGALLTEEFLRSVESDLDHVNLSMDSVSLTRQSSKALELRPGLPRLLQAASERTGMIVTSNMVLSKANEDQIEPLVRSMNAAGIPMSIGFINAPPRNAGSSVFPRELLFSYPSDLAQIRDIVSRIAELKRTGGLVIEPLRYFADFERHLAGKSVWRCEKSKPHSLQIDPSGAVMSCTRLEMAGSKLLSTNRGEIRKLGRSIAEGTATCQARCYSNCSYNNFYYRHHPLQFLRNVLIPAVS
jgi:MoaA/NifB/PqqE/SkfB family radical SAM enzyme